MSSKQYIQSSVTIQNLQNYITELSVYINQNNTKYSKNLQTLKIFYQDQINQQNYKLSQLQNEELLMKNELITFKDLLLNRESQLKQLRQKIHEYKQQNQQYHIKLMAERKQIDNIYTQLSQLKQKHNSQLNSYEQKYKQTYDQKNDYILKLKQKQQQISSLKRDINKLQHQLSERYSLPQKLHDVQLQSIKNKTLVSTLNETKRELQCKIDYLTVDVEKLRKINEKLTISNDTIKSSMKLQMNQEMNKLQNKYKQKIKNQLSINQKQLFQITQLQNTIKIIKQQNQQLQRKINIFIHQNNMYKHNIENHDQQKDKYIEQFRKLKLQYQIVINNLQQSIPLYQNKNFHLQQQNTDLNQQLDALRDLLNELKAMNGLIPLKQQYRKIAELELIANKQYKQYKNQDYNKIQTNSVIQNQKDQNQFKWDKLLADIQGINVV